MFYLKKENEVFLLEILIDDCLEFTDYLTNNKIRKTITSSSFAEKSMESYHNSNSFSSTKNRRYLSLI